jgi:hypothetical protein
VLDRARGRRKSRKESALHLPSLDLDRVWKERLSPLQEAWQTKVSLLGAPSVERAQEAFQTLVEPLALTVAWFDLLDSQDPLPYHHALARRALAKDGIPQPTNTAVAKLSYSLLEHLRELRRALGLDQLTLEELLEPPEDEGMFPLWARAARYFDQVRQGGKGSQEAALWIRKNGKERFAARQQGQTEASLEWHLFLQPALETEGLPPLAIASLLCRVLWCDLIKPRLEREQHYKAPALPIGLLDASRDALHTPSGQLLPVAQGYAITESAGRICARLEPDKLEEMARRYKVPTLEMSAITQSLQAARGLTGQRLFRHVITRGYQQMLIERALDYRTLIYPGGLAGLAKKLGLFPGRASHTLGEALDALELVRLVFENGGHDWLLKWKSTPAAPGRLAEVKITLGDPLLPGYFYALPQKTLSQRRDARLVPLPKHFPPFVGPPLFHASQAVLQLAVVEELSERAVELVETGHVQISDDRWRILAEKAEVPSKILPEIREIWVQGREETPAFLLEKAGARYTLGPAYEEELRFLIETGSKSLESTSRAKTRLSQKKLQLKKRPKKGPKKPK